MFHHSRGLPSSDSHAHEPSQWQDSYCFRGKSICFALEFVLSPHFSTSSKTHLYMLTSKGWDGAVGGVSVGRGRIDLMPLIKHAFVGKFEKAHLKVG